MGDIVEESTQKNDKNVDGKVFGQSNEIDISTGENCELGEHANFWEFVRFSSHFLASFEQLRALSLHHWRLFEWILTPLRAGGTFAVSDNFLFRGILSGLSFENLIFPRT
jgi:hypothetical protein